MSKIRKAAVSLVLSTACLVIASRVQADGPPQKTLNGVKHVLLLSIDGMHALDFINCANGISGANGGESYCPNLAGLKATGANYLYASTSRPSDSFPGAGRHTGRAGLILELQLTADSSRENGKRV